MEVVAVAVVGSICFIVNTWMAWRCLTGALGNESVITRLYRVARRHKGPISVLLLLLSLPLLIVHYVLTLTG